VRGTGAFSFTARPMMLVDFWETSAQIGRSRLEPIAFAWGIECGPVRLSFPHGHGGMAPHERHLVIIRPTWSGLGFALLVAMTAVLIGSPRVVQGQYMYLDTNGDGVPTDADTLNSSGPTLVDVWIRTDSNRDGSPASCISANKQLTLSNYDFILHATGGTIAWGTFTNQQALMLPCNGTRSDSTDFYTGFCGISGPSPGLYHLASISLRVASGTPSIRPEPSSHLWGGALTSFGSACPGRDDDNTIKLGTDWIDTDGARYGGWLNQPLLAQPANMAVAEGAIAQQEITATDSDGSTMSMTKLSGPNFMTVQTVSSAQGSATGLIRLAPGYSDSGLAFAEVRVSDGVGSDFRSFGIHVSNVNRAPQLDSIPDICIEQGQSLTVTLH